MGDELGNRNFYTLPKNTSKSAPLNSNATPEELFELIRTNEIGSDHQFITAFGKRALTYWNGATACSRNSFPRAENSKNDSQ